MSFSPEVIERAKRRYEALKAAGQDAGAFEARRGTTDAPGAIPDDRVIGADDIPGGWYWHGIVRAGAVLSVDNHAANEGVAVLMWNAADPSERLNPPDTIKLQWTAAIGRGRILVSDMGRPMASVIGGPDQLIDCLTGASTPHANRLKYGNDTHASAFDHFLRAGAKYGLDKRDVGPAISLFTPIGTNPDGALGWDASATLTGRFDLRAEMDVIAVVSNTPHPLGPSSTFASEPVRITVWHADPPGDDDLCRTASDEAVRAFQNNDAMRAGVSAGVGIGPGVKLGEQAAR